MYPPARLVEIRAASALCPICNGGLRTKGQSPAQLKSGGSKAPAAANAVRRFRHCGHRPQCRGCPSRQLWFLGTTDAQFKPMPNDPCLGLRHGRGNNRNIAEDLGQALEFPYKARHAATDQPWHPRGQARSQDPVPGPGHNNSDRGPVSPGCGAATAHGGRGSVRRENSCRPQPCPDAASAHPRRALAMVDEYADRCRTSVTMPPSTTGASAFRSAFTRRRSPELRQDARGQSINHELHGERSENDTGSAREGVSAGLPHESHDTRGKQKRSQHKHQYRKQH